MHPHTIEEVPYKKEAHFTQEIPYKKAGLHYTGNPIQERSLTL